MIQLINKLKKNQKGFTLVELIVVLVILAILAAFTIPAMLGFVNDAKGKALVAQTREVYVAYQSALTDITNGEGLLKTDASKKTSSDGEATFYAGPNTSKITSDATNVTVQDIQDSAFNKLVGDVIANDKKGTVGTLKYSVSVEGAKIKTIKLTDGKFTVTLTPDQTGGGSGTTNIEEKDDVSIPS